MHSKFPSRALFPVMGFRCACLVRSLVRIVLEVERPDILGLGPVCPDGRLACWRGRRCATWGVPDYNSCGVFNNDNKPAGARQ